jgi:hypothetical protein
MNFLVGESESPKDQGTLYCMRPLREERRERKVEGERKNIKKFEHCVIVNSKK